MRKPLKLRFFQVELKRLELSTSALRTQGTGESDAGNCGANADAAERLHQCLHQIAENGQHSVASIVLDAIANTLGTDAAARVLDALEGSAAAVAAINDGGTQR